MITYDSALLAGVRCSMSMPRTGLPRPECEGAQSKPAPLTRPPSSGDGRAG